MSSYLTLLAAMHSFLLVGPSPEKNLQEALLLAQKLTQNPLTLNHPDLLLFTPHPSITIADVRRLKTAASRKPYRLKTKTIVIHQAEHLTLPAQNALLKTLEEPPAHTLLILTTTNRHQLLPTLVSRCQKTLLSTTPTPSPSSDALYRLIPLSVGQRFALISSLLTTTDQAKDWVEKQLLYWHQFLRSPHPNLSLHQLSQILKSLTEANRLLKKNLNHRLVLENLCRQLPRLSLQPPRPTPNS